MTRFPPERGRDLTDVDYDATITDVLARCDFVGSDKDRNPSVIVTLAPVIAAARGPANVSGTGEVSYFVTVIGPDRSILQKRVFPVPLAFPGSQTRVTHTDNDPAVTIDLPLPPGRAATDFRILVGFQVSPEELDYNRRRLEALQ